MAPFDTTLAAAIDTLIPADSHPGGWAGGVEAFFRRERAGLVAPLVPLLEQVVTELDSAGFTSLDTPGRASALEGLLARPELGPAADALCRLAYEGFYAASGGVTPAGLDMVGFVGLPPGVTDPIAGGSAPPDPPLSGWADVREAGASTAVFLGRFASLATVEPSPWPTIDPQRLRPAYDVVVVGAGAGGGVVAGVLAEAGARVLLVERAPLHTNAELRGDHLRGKRAALYQVTASPGPGHPRVIDTGDGPRRIESESAFEWGLNAMTLGGGTRVWQGMAWRFMPEDFAMTEHYPVPDGSTLADWPFRYDELAPYYDRAEWEIGVSGEEGALTARTPRSRGYPMGPLAGEPQRAVFGDAADRLGWGWGPIPFCLNSVPRAGRAACVRCDQCVGHACPTDAKNGTHNTLIRRALATGSCDLLAAAQVLAIEHLGSTATGVRLVVDGPGGPTEHHVAAGRIVVSAGAVETPRLLLVSGLGNDWVGRNLHSHTGAFAIGELAEPMPAGRGPGHHVATMDFVHRDGEGWGGGVIFDGFPFLPVVLAQMAVMFGVPRWGAAHKRWMRENLPRLAGTMAIGQEIPSELARVTADPDVRDRFGMPVARLRGHTHSATYEAAGYLMERCRWWLDETGAAPLPLPFARGTTPPAATEHSAGTCRMGDDPSTSACDRWGRVHGTDNVFVADASLHPTNGSVNPGLTVMANAFRVAEHVAAL